MALVADTLIPNKQLEKFKSQYEKYGKYKFDYQIPHLETLAEGYFTRYQLTNNWTDALRAHALFNSIKARTSDDGKKEQWEQRAFEVQETLWKDQVCMTTKKQNELTHRFASKLASIRVDIEQELVELSAVVKNDLSPENESLFQRKALSISNHCTEELINLSHDIMAESVHMMNKAPRCAFSVVVFGSMAKGEATPYSDLEYLFLVEDACERNQQYFEILAVTSYLLIGNLAETKLSYMAIEELEGWFDDTQINGFKIDGLAKGTGNIPTGNGLPGTRNKYILTPRELFERYKEVYENPTDEALRGDLTAMLTYTKEIFSHGVEAENLLSEFLSHKSNLMPNEDRQAKNMEMFRNDIIKFQLEISNRLVDSGYGVNMKKQLYRYPSIVLFDLTIILSACTENTSWETLLKLKQQNMISAEICESMLFLLASVCYSRLSAYIHHNSHDDRVTLLDFTPEPIMSKNVDAKKADRWHIPQPLLQLQCKKLLPLQRHFEAVTESKKGIDHGILMKVLSDKFATSPLDPAWMHFAFGQWHKALKIFECHVKNFDSLLSTTEQIAPSYIANLASMAWTYYHCDKLEISKRMFLKLVTKMESILDADDYNPRHHEMILAGLAATQSMTSEHKQARQTKEKVLEIHLKYFRDDINGLMVYKTNLGLSLIELKVYTEAEKLFLEVWKMCNENVNREVHDYFGYQTMDAGADSKPTAGNFELHSLTPEQRLKQAVRGDRMLAEVVKDLGRVYYETKKLNLAKLYYFKASELLHEFFGKMLFMKILLTFLTNWV